MIGNILEMTQIKGFAVRLKGEISIINGMNAA
jgi:hypothetical protein